MANPGQADCAIEGSGEEICVTPVAFAGTTLRALNHSCGWAPEMRFDRLLQAREARELPAVALQGIIYQLPPPSSMRPLAEARAQLAADGEGCQVVFLATDASFDEIRELNSSLKGTPLLRFDPAPLLPRAGAGEAEDARETLLDFSGKPERAIMDTLICAFADAFLATRLSIFSWNILEERIVQGMAAETGRYM
ncbi:hypothetical protein Ctob_008111 [Chrysochromulina tobinii]|uniref:Uncharacterized protein n=1 Tax=Chrysochromulina tobinii TaxID=1460289 RepID=A0A0M0K6X8_9EUKA|nr:hypothetical protein Ctob_008111 [Chrysochromulina tobinii]|eukprot:KOO34143.1 hypothetical protein Ctob_008111 [Chrysochromulina sp. CCMP291]